MSAFIVFGYNESCVTQFGANVKIFGVFSSEYKARQSLLHCKSKTSLVKRFKRWQWNKNCDAGNKTTRVVLNPTRVRGWG